MKNKTRTTRSVPWEPAQNPEQQPIVKPPYPGGDIPITCARAATKRRIRIVQYGKVWYVEMRQSGNDTYRSVNGTTKERAMEKARNLVLVTGGMMPES